jgi:Putative adhesin
MSNQQSMNPEQPQPYEPRNINTDPREQGKVRSPLEPTAGGFYNSPEQQTMGGEKLRPQQRRRGGLWFLLILLLVVVLAMGGLVGSVVSRTGSFQFGSLSGSLPAHSFTVSGIPKLVIHDDTGTIHIHTGGAGGTDVIVKAARHATGIGANVNDLNVNYALDGSTIDINAHVTAHGIFVGSRSIDLDITTPSTSNIEANTGSGTVEIDGVTGQMMAEAGSGSISTNNVNGDITLSTGSGSIHADSISGQVTLKTGSGGIEANHAALKGQSLLETGSGSIRFEGSIDAEGDYRFETGSGSIDATLPSGSTFRPEISTGSGSVHNDFAGNDVGNGSGPTLTLHTGSGSINLRKGS